MLRFILSLGTALAAIPETGAAQTCSQLDIFQDFSFDDTFNSSGSALDAAYAVFQQDRFYVNQRSRLDPGDRQDPLMVTRQARAVYGQAVRDYLSVNGYGDMATQALIGRQYIVRVEACGTPAEPSITVIAMRTGSHAQDILRLETTHACVRCDLRGADLFDYDLTGANLQYANLDNASLEEVDLSRANLEGASFVGAHLDQALLAGANLTDANLEGASLSGAELEGANLHSAWLRGADLQGASLVGANLSNAVLHFANLAGATMSGAHLCNTIMPDGAVISNGC